MPFKTSLKIRLARRKRYQENKEKSKLYAKQYRKKNKKKVKDYNEEYRKKNRSKLLKKHKIYRLKNSKKIKDLKKKWDDKNKEYKKKYRREWYLKNKDRVAKLHKTKKYRLIQKNLRIKNKDKNSAYSKLYRSRPKTKELKRIYNKKYAPTLRKRVAIRKKTDVNFKLRLALSKRVLVAVKSAKTKKSFKTIKLIGCSIATMRKHLEKKFKKGMTWQNHGRYGWHIDHIRPLEKFDLSDPKQLCF